MDEVHVVPAEMFRKVISLTRRWAAALRSEGIILRVTQMRLAGAPSFRGVPPIPFFSNSVPRSRPAATASWD